MADRRTNLVTSILGKASPCPECGADGRKSHHDVCTNCGIYSAGETECNNCGGPLEDQHVESGGGDGVCSDCKEAIDVGKLEDEQERHFYGEAAENLVAAISNKSALGIEASFKEAISQKVLSAIEERRPEVLDSMFDAEGNYQREDYNEPVSDSAVNHQCKDCGAPISEEEAEEAGDPYRCKKCYSGFGGVNQSGDKDDDDDDADDAGEAVSEAANWPRKAHSIHSDIEDAGYTYQRTNGKFHVYENPDGDQIRHSFPTLNGNHSFAHYDLNGHPLFKSNNTGSTEIKQHLKKVKKPSTGSVESVTDLKVKDPRMGVRESTETSSYTITNSLANAIGIAHKLHQRKAKSDGFPIWKKGDDFLVQLRKSDISDSGWEHVATRFPQHTEIHDKNVAYSHFGESFNSGWKEEKDAGTPGWLERRHKAADASGNLWKYEDARGVEKHGYLSGYSDFGGTDHIQWMRDHQTGQLDLVSGSRLKASNIVPRTKKAELLGLKVESCISESQTYGTPGCKGCENDTYNGVCMDCTKARARAATTRGGCKCGSKKVPSTVKSNGLGRSWISCERCFGQIKQLS